MGEQEHLDTTPDSTELRTLAWALSERAAIKIAEDSLAERKIKANTSFTLAVARLGIDKYVGPEGGLTLKAGGTTSTLDKEKMVAGFLTAGVGAGKIKEIMDGATTKKPKLGSVEFYPRKE